MAFLRHQTSRKVSISTDCMDGIVDRLNAKPFVAPTRVKDKTSAENEPAPPPPPPPPPPWRWAMMAWVALCIAPVVGYFAWQNSAKEAPRATAPVSNSNAPFVNDIPAIQAQMYVGQHKIVCGQIAELKEVTAGLFINFDTPHPNEVTSGIIWRRNINIIDTLQLKENQRVCISGLIENYQGKPQMEIDRREQNSALIVGSPHKVHPKGRQSGFGMRSVPSNGRPYRVVLNKSSGDPL